MLLAFFVPSVALSRIGRARKKLLTDIGKGGARDAWQVLANGGIATACAVAAAAVRPAPRKDAARDAAPGNAGAWIAAFAGAYAAATADTWGTEVGTLARGAPRSILTLEPIPTGMSGGVTVAGSAAEVAGAAWLALCATALVDALGSAVAREAPANGAADEPAGDGPRIALFTAVLVGGVTGAFVDSVLGATLQELRRCPQCERTCETNPHSCGTATELVRGIPGFSNDLVNFAATLTGAATASVVHG